MTSIVVQKYGGSVLTGQDAYVQAARHVARTVARGRRVVAVVSALAGVTDQLFAQARGIHNRPAAGALDLLLASGELQSAALLALALHRLGMEDATALNPWQLGLHTDGSHGDARITRINPLPLRVKLSEHRAVVVPGFLGRGKDDALTTLGRGGSDLSAVALAHALQSEACEFFKDVPGYFSADPNRVKGTLHRPAVTGREALVLSRFGCRFLQDKAIDWAVKTRCRVLLRALGEDDRATKLIDRAGTDHPRVLALTHCPWAERLIPERPEDLGPEPALLSLAGAGLHKETTLDSAILQLLLSEDINARLVEATGIRLTLALPGEDLDRAQQRIHDHVILNKQNRIAEKGDRHHAV
jgi:aspartate kinase